MSDTILEKIDATLADRRQADSDQSYVASLYEKGVAAIVSKIREEAEETCQAAHQDDDAHLIHEVADLWFHCQVLLAHRHLNVGRVFKELERRFGTSGHEEKKSRTQKKPIRKNKGG